MPEPIAVGYKWLDHGRGLALPAHQSDGAAGADLLAALDVSEPVTIAPGKRATIPCGFDRDGMPIGLQIVAPWLEESRIFRVAAAFEAAAPDSGRWPAFVNGD